MVCPALPHYITAIYHRCLGSLPWGSFRPQLGALEAMMRLKMDERLPPACFVFLGAIFPLFDWQDIVDGYW